MKNTVHSALYGAPCAILFLGVMSAEAADSAWTNALESMAFYEGDSYGTVAHDLYVDAANPAVNYNGQGLNLKWSGNTTPERPGYIRFDNILSQIPAESFVYRATLQLTATNTSTGTGWVKVGARGPYGFDEATVTYSSMASRAAVAPTAGLTYDQLYSKDWGATLSNQTININVTPAVRAWSDFYQNRATGYTNAGFCININPAGAGGDNNSVFLADSENADVNKRPRLTIQYLPPTSWYKAVLYVPVASNSWHAMRVVPEDAPIRQKNTSGGQINLYTNNYGGMTRDYTLYSLDGPSGILLRWPNLQLPSGPYVFADARFRFNGNDGWNVYGYSPANIEVRQCLRP